MSKIETITPSTDVKVNPVITASLLVAGAINGDVSTSQKVLDALACFAISETVSQTATNFAILRGKNTGEAQVKTAEEALVKARAELDTANAGFNAAEAKFVTALAEKKWAEIPALDAARDVEAAHVKECQSNYDFAYSEFAAIDPKRFDAEYDKLTSKADRFRTSGKKALIALFGNKDSREELRALFAQEASAERKAELEEAIKNLGTVNTQVSAHLADVEARRIANGGNVPAKAETVEVAKPETQTETPKTE